MENIGRWLTHVARYGPTTYNPNLSPLVLTFSISLSPSPFPCAAAVHPQLVLHGSSPSAAAAYPQLVLHGSSQSAAAAARGSGPRPSRGPPPPQLRRFHSTPTRLLHLDTGGAAPELGHSSPNGVPRRCAVAPESSSPSPSGLRSSAARPQLLVLHGSTPSGHPRQVASH
jgi:hypothetical protein